MNFVRKTAATFGAISFAVLLLAALAPKAARGVAATLVQVTNTASNAVPTEDGPGNFPFGIAGCAAVGNSDCGSVIPPSVPVTTSTGAAVKRLVIEDLSVGCSGSDPGAVVSIFALLVPMPVDHLDQIGFGSLRYEFPLTATGSGQSIGHSPVRIYADPGTAISNEIFGTLGVHGGLCGFNLTGHLETK